MATLTFSLPLSSLIWLLACLLSLIHLHLPSPPPRGRLRWSYTVYLSMHILQCLVTDQPELRTSVLGIAGCSYIAVGANIYAGGGQGAAPSYVKNCTVFAAVLSAVQFLCTVTGLVNGVSLYSYVFGVLFAMGCILVEVFKHKHGDKGDRNKLLLSAVAGCVDALIPMLFTSETVDLELVARCLDSVLYLPAIVYVLRRYDDRGVGGGGLMAKFGF